MGLLRWGVGVGVGVGAGVAGVGWFYSSVLLAAGRPFYPERVVAVGPGTVTLRDSVLAAQPGTWGLRWVEVPGRPEQHVTLGPVVRREPGRRGIVVRPVLGGQVPRVGAVGAVDAALYQPDPQARGLPFTEVDVAGPLGDYPAWLIPAERSLSERTDNTDGDTWVITVHGRGGNRREGLRIAPALRDLGLPQLAITYRNDETAPPSPDGWYHLGDTEWADLEAAVRYALDHGARRVVLYGWSMGAAIIGAFLGRSAFAACVAAVVWDAPLVDWRATLRQQARNRHLPGGLSPLATLATTLRTGIDFDPFDLRSNPPAVRPPTLLIHSDGDTAVPVEASRDLAAEAPELDWPIRYVEVPGVEHTASWNADPARYERLVTSFLTEALEPAATGGAAAGIGRAGTMGT